MERYSLLWIAFEEKEFEHDDAAKILKEEKEGLVSAVLSELKKHGWLLVKLHPDDSRRRIYSLILPDTAIRNIGNKK